MRTHNDHIHVVPWDAFWDTKSAQALGFSVGGVVRCEECGKYLICWYGEPDDWSKPIDESEANSSELPHWLTAKYLLLKAQ